MNKSLIKAAYNIVTQAKNKVPDNSLHRQIRELTGTGSLDGRSITLTEQCRSTIERFFDMEIGQPLIELNFKAKSRHDSSDNPDEKWSTEGVFSNLINITTLGNWPFKESPVIPAGVILSGTKGDFDFSNIKAVVVVENGEILTQWEKTAKLMPPPFNSAVAIYRGHGQNIKKVKELIKSLNIPIGLYFDFDPKGLEIAMEYNQKEECHLIIPEATPEQLKLITKQSAFEKQFEALQRLIKAKKQYYSLAITMKKFEIAVMQEKIAKNRICLRLFKL